MIHLEKIKVLLDQTLSLNGRTSEWNADTHLLGAIPELDSLAVVHVITAIEKEFSIMIDDNDINADNFRTLGTLCTFVTSQLQ